MTYLNWGCEPLKEECESCLDVLCNVCDEEFRKNHRIHEIGDGAGETGGDSFEPDCDTCDREKKPDCSRCEIILTACANCSGNKTCEFRICDSD